MVKATVGAAERRVNIQPEWHMARKPDYIYDVTFPTVFADEFKKMLWS